MKTLSNNSARFISINHTVASTIGLSLMMLALPACQQSPQYGFIEGETMGTSYHIRYEQPESGDTTALKAAIDQRLIAINDSMSTYQDNSVITRFNRLPAGQSIQVDPDFIKVLAISKTVYGQSQGAFDPTVMPLIDAWGFGGKMTVDHLQNPPTADEIAKAKALIDFEAVKLDGQNLSKSKEGVALDFSAVAKGYGVDAIAEVLAHDYKIKNYMVEIGGEVATSGVNERHKPWQIAIDAPLTDSTVSSRETLTVIRQPKHENNGNPGRMSLATSGNYRNSVVFDGVRYSHTIDPIQGTPVVGGAPSVSVAADSVALADAWATALTAMPYEKALAIASELDLAAMFVVPKTGKIESSEEVHDWQIVETSAMQSFRGVNSAD